MTLSVATTSGKNRPGSDGNKEVLHIPQSSSITRASPSDCFVSFRGHWLWEYYPSAEVQSVYSAALADWVTRLGDSDMQKLTVQSRFTPKCTHETIGISAGVNICVISASCLCSWSNTITVRML